MWIEFLKFKMAAKVCKNLISFDLPYSYVYVMVYIWCWLEKSIS